MGRKRKFENRYEVIIKAASHVFIDKGFENTTMDDIAKACDLGKATLYTEFPSKEALMNAVISEYAKQAVYEMQLVAQEAKAPFMDAVFQILYKRILTVFQRATTHFHSVEVLMATRANETSKPEYLERKDEEYRIIARLLEKAAENNEIPKSSDYFAMSKLLFKALRSLMPPNIFQFESSRFSQEAETIIKLYLSGLKVYSPV